MFALLCDGSASRERELVGVFAYRSIAEANAKELMAEREYDLFFIQALPFDSVADGYLPANEHTEPALVPHFVGRRTS